jgi:hypothetical protein
VKRPLGFVDGIGVGIGSLMLLPLLYWMLTRGQFVEMYKQLGTAKLPSLTILAMHPAYGFGVPILLGLGFGLAIWKRPTRWAIFAVGAAALVASIFTFYAAYLPMWQLAGNIR